jgi:hypothetical protein
MNNNARAPQAPESYATFWEPVAADAAPGPAPAPAAPGEAKDAYLEFTNVTEGIPARRGDRP